MLESSGNPKIIHIDIDAFFASVEVNDNPVLKGKPVIVGGLGERGVVSTCSYEARKYGVRSAMPAFIARKKCPNAIFLPVRMSRYKEMSQRVFQVCYSITDLVEPISIDEAYLDVSNLDMSPVEIAKNIKKQIKGKTGLTVSVGISYNKFLAKLASDWDKPNGMKIIKESDVPEILRPLSIDKVHGLGNKSVEKLKRIGIYTIDDLLKLPMEFFVEYFGKGGIELYDRIRGLDKRKVKVSRNIKSIGRERTLSKDIISKETMEKYIEEFSSAIEYSLRARGLSCKTVTIKYKTVTFKNHSKSKTLNEFIQSRDELKVVALEILKDINFDEKIRLIGLSVSTLEDNSIKQLSLFT